MAVKKSELYSTLWKCCDELRGGMDASQYKDYVLVILFVKYISDKSRSDAAFDIEIPEGCYFEDFVALKGNPNIGEEINKKMQKLAEANQLDGVFVADFDDEAKLGKGKDKVETLSKLIAVFQNENLDFSKNRAADDNSEVKKLSVLAEKFTREMLIYHCKMLEEALISMNASGAVKRIIAELCFVKMCDDNLSTSNEALLLRISKLEALISSGNFTPQKTNEESKADNNQNPKSEEKPVVIKEQEKKVIAEPAPVKTVEAPKVQKTAPIVTDSYLKKPLKAWSEAVQSIESLDRGAYAFLKKTRAYLGEDSRIHVLSDGFGLFAIDKPSVKSALASALSRQLDRSFGENDILYEKDDGKVRIEDDNSDLDAFDDFMNN